MGRKVLLVEGKNDEHVIKHFSRVRGIPLDEHKVEIVAHGNYDNESAAGVESLIKSIAVRLKMSELERIAIVIDADEDANARWNAVRDRLRASGHTSIPEQPESHGTVVDLRSDVSPIRVGIWIMPDNVIAGTIERFLAFLVGDEDDALLDVDTMLEGIDEDRRRFSEAKYPKARLHAYLSIQKHPGLAPGMAIAHRILDAGSEAANPFAAWLRRTLID